MIIHEIPAGKARTGKYRKTVRLLVLEVQEGFRTLNSKHRIISDLGTARADYWTVRGYYAWVMAKARDIAIAHGMDFLEAK